MSSSSESHGRFHDSRQNLAVHIHACVFNKNMNACVCTCTILHPCIAVPARKCKHRTHWGAYTHDISLFAYTDVCIDKQTVKEEKNNGLTYLWRYYNPKTEEKKYKIFDPRYVSAPLLKILFVQ